eukprot:CAMPEP_0204825248 /NCGR_PEP_ID=MMETSP1346-20131115/3175_1 /ASSEMBLY_ACC=CAM_ASM_000771 /TAXON_ID=215587 /ORGANISM="Aplanochytrium stocchinoi, Strain GSBS06" /LENGTH=175 /DNA_ID=CAMNT_0051952815 /DNA_START=124 /DNA_END=651 /DNA_ORIENTATION=-
MNDRLLKMVEEIAIKPRKAKSSDFTCVLSKLLQKTYKLYRLLCALNQLFDNNQEVPKPSLEMDDNEAEEDYKLVIATIKMWWQTGGRVHEAFKTLDGHFCRVKNRGIPICNQFLSGVGIEKLEGACSECIVFVDRAVKLLRQFNHSVKFKSNVSPKSKKLYNKLEELVPNAIQKQ